MPHMNVEAVKADLQRYRDIISIAKEATEKVKSYRELKEQFDEGYGGEEIAEEIDSLAEDIKELSARWSELLPSCALTDPKVAGNQNMPLNNTRSIDAYDIDTLVSQVELAEKEVAFQERAFLGSDKNR